MMLIDYTYVGDGESYRVYFSKGRHIVIHRMESDDDEWVNDEVVYEGHEHDCLDKMRELKANALVSMLY